MIDLDLCPKCDEYIIEEKVILPETLCPCDNNVSDIIIKKIVPITEYCLNRYLYNLIYQKNCNNMPKGC